MQIGHPDAIGIALGGMRLAQSRMDADASTIAANGPDVGAMVDVGVQELTFAANVTVARAGDELLGSLLDVLA